jgi:FkbM family methyltransferase
VINFFKQTARQVLQGLGILSSVRRLRTKINLLLGKGYFVPVAISLPTVYLGSDHAGYSIFPNNLNSKSIVYSFGLGDDISFDLDIIERFGCSVFGSDPTPKSIEYLKKLELPELFKFYEYAIADYNGEIKLFFPKNQQHVSLLSGNDGQRDGRSQIFPCVTLKSFMALNNHQHIDLVKMDIKGPEFSIIKQLIENNISFDQLIVEFTPEIFPNGKQLVEETIDLLSDHGYYVFCVSDDGRNISIARDNNHLRNIN